MEETGCIKGSRCVPRNYPFNFVKFFCGSFAKLLVFFKDLEVPLAFDRSSTSAGDFRAKYGFERPGEDVGTKMLLLCRWGKLRK